MVISTHSQNAYPARDLERELLLKFPQAAEALALFRRYGGQADWVFLQGWAAALDVTRSHQLDPAGRQSTAIRELAGELRRQLGQVEPAAGHFHYWQIDVHDATRLRCLTSGCHATVLARMLLHRNALDAHRGRLLASPEVLEQLGIHRDGTPRAAGEVEQP